MYYLRSRYYQSDLERFINADLLIEANLFNYSNCQPVNMVDNNGFDAVWITDTAMFSHASLLIQNKHGKSHKRGK